MEPRYGYVTDQTAMQVFQGLLGLVEAYVLLEERWQDATEAAFGSDAVVAAGNNGAEYFEEIRTICREALGIGPFAP